MRRSRGLGDVYKRQTKGAGLQEARIAYVLNQEDLKKAVICLEKALEVYPGRTN
jgi:aspartate aminotransferase